MQIVILGGGSAGWLTAGILAAEYQQDDNVTIHLVESPDVAPIGVGEGTWPTMRTTLSKIGLCESEFIRECSASFKQGSKFVGWSTGEKDDSYYHPFTAPKNADFCSVAAWHASGQRQNYSVSVSAQPAVGEAFLAPKQVATPEYAGVLNYGYHLDAGKFGQLLMRHCTQNLKVKHTLDTVSAVLNCKLTESITGLQTNSHGVIKGDLFIDCSGSRGLLIGEHYKIPFVDCSHLSINDTALAAHVPYIHPDDPIQSVTVSTAQACGWTWDIGLSSRRGVGYVYSSQYCDRAAAEQTLRDYVAFTANAEIAQTLNIRSLDIRPGYRKEFWHKNCVSVGMAAGFIEPLEASALALVELSANLIRDELPRSKEAMPIVAERFNNIFYYRWQRILEFLKLHYVLSARRDTPYWRDVTSDTSITKNLEDLLLLWRDRAPNQYDFLQVEELFPAISYQYVLYGMGYNTRFSNTPQQCQSASLSAEYIESISHDAAKFKNHLPSNRQLINHISKYDLTKI
ncbi:tryptophan halogenase family protein [Marinagarivorans algicola]|uniref:tryptophan halogenase family protein n=1 Tax=Marinagarivorans algicola TaxID=1513270 RepID=UPI0037361F35